MTGKENQQIYPLSEQLIAVSSDKLRLAVNDGKSSVNIAAYFKKVLHTVPELAHVLAIQIDQERFVLSNGQVVLSVTNIPPERVISLKQTTEAISLINQSRRAET